MNQKKAKALRRLARFFVMQTNKPQEDVNKEYKKIKKSYKLTNGKI